MYSPSKHEASKKGHKHTQKTKFKIATGLGMTNHMRCIYFRAKRLGIKPEEYMRQFPKL
jgi:hypothetical protein